MVKDEAKELQEKKQHEDKQLRESSSSSSALSTSAAVQQVEDGKDVKEAKEAKEAAFVDALDAVEDLLDARRRLQDQLALGFMSLVRARYSLGAGSLSQADYDYASMAATATMRVSDGTTSSAAGLNEDEHSQGPSWLVFTACSKKGGAADSAKDDGDSTDDDELDEAAVQSALQGLRRRANAAGVTGRASPSDFSDWEKVDLPQENQVLEGVKDVDGKPVVPPIRWFGVLVPPAMREAQQQFTKALELVAEVATAAARYQSNRGVYDKLCQQEGGQIAVADA